MFRKKKRVNPDIAAAKKKRDDLMKESATAIREVDDLQERIIEEYRKTEENSWK